MADNDDLRQRAEARHRAQPVDWANLSPDQIQHLVHELQVHQIELEKQNEELRRTQVELDAARARYFDLYDLAPVGYFSLSGQGLILEANLTAATLLGVARDKLVEQPLSRFISQEDQDLYYLHRKQLFETGTSQACELRLVKNDGTPFWANLEAIAAQAADGAPVCRIALSNITGRKQAEAAWRASEEKYRLLINNANEAILVAQDGLLKFVNPMAFSLFGGYSEQELIDRPFLELIHPDDRSLVVENYRRRIAHEVLLPRYDFRALTRDGLKWVEINVTLIEWQGQPATLNFLTEITERKRAEESLRGLNATLEQRVAERTAQLTATNEELEHEIIEHARDEAALRESEEKYRTLVRYSSDPIFSIDREGRYLFVNGAMARVFAKTPEEIIGQPLRRFFPPAEADRRLATIRQVFDTGQSQAIDGVVMTASGEARHYLTMADPVTDASGQVLFVSCVSRDITEIRRAEDELRRALAQEHELSELKSQFISMASHDFRTPLTSILTSADLLEHYSARLSDEKKLTYLQRIQTSVRHMTQLLDDVLILGRADAGKLDFAPAPIDLVAFSRTALDELRRTATSQHTLEFEQVGDFTGARLDEKLLRQILNNLLSNAIKYSPAGGPIRLSLRRDQANVIITVADHGLGIPPEAQLHLYESFYRAKNVGETPGTGLGLPIVKRAVDAHHGAIEVASTVGAGTTFTLTLPLQPPGASEE